MNILRIPFASQRQRDQALGLLENLAYDALDKSEPAGAGVRPLPGESRPGLADGRRQIIFAGEYLPQWATAVGAALAWRVGRTHEDTPWATLFLNEDLLPVAATSLDVRGTRGLLEVDDEGRLLGWRNGGRTRAGPRMATQVQAVDQLLAALAACAKTPKPRQGR
jgi:hypothetical protein